MSTVKFNTWQNADGTENFKVRAWVNFNGTGTVAIRASGNVSSITDLSTGVFRANFANPMPDADYAAFLSAGGTTSVITSFPSESVARTTTGFTFGTGNTAFASSDAAIVNVVVIR